MRHTSPYLLAGLLSIAGCHSSSENPNRPLVGEIEGQVRIFAPNGGPQLNDGIQISIEDGEQTQADSDGNWRLHDIPVGTHIVTASKHGYGSLRMYNIQVAPDGLAYAPSYSVYSTYLFPRPTGTVVQDSVTIQTYPQDGSRYDQFTMYVHFDTITALAEYLDTNAFAPVEGPHVMVWLDGNPGSNKFMQSSHRFSELETFGVKRGQTLYFSTSDYNNGGQTSNAGNYYDPTVDYNLPISPGRKSNVISFIVP